jgi:hypothetical protein
MVGVGEALPRVDPQEYVVAVPRRRDVKSVRVQVRCTTAERHQPPHEHGEYRHGVVVVVLVVLDDVAVLVVLVPPAVTDRLLSAARRRMLRRTSA